MFSWFAALATLSMTFLTYDLNPPRISTLLSFLTTTEQWLEP